MFVESSDLFASGLPSRQNMVDIFAGQWKTAFPTEMELEAGTSPYFDDTRVQWTAARVDLKGKDALELGPFEGYNTVHLCREGARKVVAIEANKINYLKCLIVKELFGVAPELRLGEFTGYLETTDERFDLCFASGVLYHQIEPLRFLQAVSRVAPAVFIWTHYYDEPLLRSGPNWKFFEGLDPVQQSLGDFNCQVHPRSYLFKRDGAPPRKFSGGLQDFAYWMKYDDILAFLERLGFDDIEVRNRGEHPAGPTVSLLARRSHFCDD